MDFLEGFLLGPLWSDTEYETQKHVGFHLFWGAVISGCFLWLLIFPESMTLWRNLPVFLYFFFFIVFLVSTPFAARLYYQVALPVKFLILLLQVMKLACAYMISFNFFLPRYQLNLAELPQTFMDEINESISSATEFFDQFGRTSGMLLGIVGGGLMIVLRIVLILVIAVLVPILILYAVRLLQWAWDYFAQRHILRESHR